MYQGLTLVRFCIYLCRLTFKPITMKSEEQRIGHVHGLVFDVAMEAVAITLRNRQDVLHSCYLAEAAARVLQDVATDKHDNGAAQARYLAAQAAADLITSIEQAMAGLEEIQSMNTTGKGTILLPVSNPKTS